MRPSTCKTRKASFTGVVLTFNMELIFLSLIFSWLFSSPFKIIWWMISTTWSRKGTESIISFITILFSDIWYISLVIKYHRFAGLSICFLKILKTFCKRRRGFMRLRTSARRFMFSRTQRILSFHVLSVCPAGPQQGKVAISDDSKF